MLDSGKHLPKVAVLDIGWMIEIIGLRRNGDGCSIHKERCCVIKVLTLLCLQEEVVEYTYRIYVFAPFSWEFIRSSAHFLAEKVT